MSTPTTNYLVLDPNTIPPTYYDLGQIFEPLTTSDTPAPKTGFTYLDANGNQTDINTLFAPWSTGKLQLPYNTNMISLNGQDLNNVFAAKSPNINDYINVDGLYTYSYDATTNYFTVVFADYTTDDPMSNPSAIGNSSSSATLTFKISVNNVQFTLVGGGGGGGANSFNYASGGGGGQGGGNNSYVPTTTVGTYNLQVGGGGLGTSGNGEPGTDTTVSQLSDQLSIALGGNFGQMTTNNYGGKGGCCISNGGDGGNGADFFNQTPGNGAGGSYVSIYENGPSYYYGGGGGGGYASVKIYSKGGIGGGGGGGDGSGNNQSQPYSGPNGIYYGKGVYGNTGMPSTGGGGAGGGAFQKKSPGAQGGSGIIIVTFQAI